VRNGGYRVEDLQYGADGERLGHNRCDFLVPREEIGQLETQTAEEGEVEQADEAARDEGLS